MCGLSTGGMFGLKKGNKREETDRRERGEGEGQIMETEKVVPPSDVESNCIIFGCWLSVDSRHC